jgi:HSP20 family protein
MAKTAIKLPVEHGKKEVALKPRRGWQALEDFKEQIDRLFDELPSWRSPFRRPLLSAAPFSGVEWKWGAVPAVDIVEKDNAYEVTAELPGLDEKNIAVKYSDGMLTIRGEKEEAKEEKKKDYHLSERRYGSFQRSFSVPDGVDPDKIVANFSKGVLTVALPKSAEAQKKEKTIAVTAK